MRFCLYNVLHYAETIRLPDIFFCDKGRKIAPYAQFLQEAIEGNELLLATDSRLLYPVSGFFSDTFYSQRRKLYSVNKLNFS